SLRATAAPAGRGGVRAPRVPRLLPRGTLVGQVPRGGAVARAGAAAAQGVGLRRFRDYARLRGDRAHVSGRRTGGVGLGGGHGRALGGVVLVVAPRPGRGRSLNSPW